MAIPRYIPSHLWTGGWLCVPKIVIKIKFNMQYVLAMVFYLFAEEVWSDGEVTNEINSGLFLSSWLLGLNILDLEVSLSNFLKGFVNIFPFPSTSKIDICLVM